MRLLELVVFCFGASKGMMYLGITLGGLAYLVSLSASSIISRHTRFDEQVMLPSLTRTNLSTGSAHNSRKLW